MARARALPPTYAGKSTRPGGGGRAAKMKAEIMAEGLSAERAGKIIGAVGRRKYGAAQMAKWSAAGRKRGK